jgi:hypothetical protein
MHGESMGILLEKKEWQQLSEQLLNGTRNSRLLDYVNLGAQSGVKVLFFNIEEINQTENIGTAIGMNDEQEFFIQTLNIPDIVYNTLPYFRKIQSQMLMELAVRSEQQIINEQTNIKKKHLFEILKAKAQFLPYLPESDFPKGRECICVIGQKKHNHNWEISGLYAKDCEGELKSFDDFPNPNLMEVMRHLSHDIFTAIQYYFPGVDELGLKFSLNQDGTPFLHSTFSVYSILAKIKRWNREFYQKIVIWPLLRAKFLYEKSLLTPEIKIHKQTQDANSVDNWMAETKMSNSLPVFWIKIKPYSCKKYEVKVPGILAGIIQTIPQILKFGVKEEACEVISFEDSVPIWNSSYHYPIEIFLSDSLIEKMHIPADLIYQIRFEEKRAVIGPSIGFLLGEKVQQYHLRYMDKFLDRFGEYERFGGVVIAFSTKSIDWKEQIAYGMVYDFAQKQWRYDSAPIPNSLYRRNFHQDNYFISLLKELTNDNLFNSYHFKKSDLYTLKHELEIKNHLPETYLLRDFQALLDFLYLKKKIILKPASLSRGRGIFILEVNEGEISLTDYRESEKVHRQFTMAEDLKIYLEQTGILKQDYIYQTYISLLKVENRPFDVRIVMQKYNKMKWFCTGIECRVAKENEDLTNIARGGDAMTLEEVIKKTGLPVTFSTIYNNIMSLCQRFCQLMDQFEEHFAEFGIDIALDETGYPWLLEANIYPSFKGFKRLDYETYLKIRYQPLFYAVQIQDFKILDRDEVSQRYSFLENISNRT